MKTALQIVQDLCGLINIPKPSALYGETDPATVQLLGCLYSACERIRAAKCFPQMKRTALINTEAARVQYPLPTDYYAPLFDTYWNDTQKIKLNGPLDDNAYVFKLRSGSSSSTNYSFRVAGPNLETTLKGQLWLDPAPTGVEELSFEYLSTQMFVPSSWTSADTAVRDRLLADTDLVIFDYDLVQLGVEAEYVLRNGGDSNPAEIEFVTRLERAAGRHKGSYVGSMSGDKEDGPIYSVPRGGLSF